MHDLVVALSYFDKKVGPTVFMEVPEQDVGEDVKIVLNQIFDQTTSEGFFWHSLSGRYTTSLNYYFEIKSEWARGLKEMLMCSLVFKDKLTSDKEHDVLSWMIDFIQKMHSKIDVFKAFYYAPQVGLDHVESATEMLEQYFLIQRWMKELFWSVREEIRKKAEEEVIASLMVDEAIHETIRKLGKHPLKIDHLRTWFHEQQFFRDFDHVLMVLEREKFIFINNIGHETYVLLVKDVNITRVPPACVLEMFDKKDAFQPLIEYYIQIVGEYFERYQPANDNKHQLYEILAQPKHYNLITELRKGPVPKAKIGSLLRQGPVVATRLNVLEELKVAGIIEEFDLIGTVHVMLKTDLSIRQNFPEYIQKALPEHERAEVAPKATFQNIPGDLFDLFAGQKPVELVSNGTHAFEANPGSLMEEMDSPFDLIVDEISSKFMSEQHQKDRARKESNGEGNES